MARARKNDRTAKPSGTAALIRKSRETLATHGKRWLGDEAFRTAGRDYWLPRQRDDAAWLPLFESWLFYDWVPKGQGRTIASDWLARNDAQRVPEVVALVRRENERALSFFRIESRARGAVLSDLLTEERTRIDEPWLPQSAAAGELVFGRVVELERSGSFASLAETSLASDRAGRVVEWLEDNLNQQIPVVRAELRRVGNELVECYGELIDEKDEPSEELAFFTTDGELFVACRETFGIVDGARDQVVEALGKLALETKGDPSKIPVTFSWIKKSADGAPGPVLGELILRAEELVLETKSRERRDKMKSELLDALGALVCHTGSEEKSQADLLASSDEEPEIPSVNEMPPELTVETIRSHLSAHYARWPDQALEALGGRSPRDAVATPAGKIRVEAIIRDMERRARGPMSDAYDFDDLRRALGIGGGSS